MATTETIENFTEAPTPRRGFLKQATIAGLSVAGMALLIKPSMAQSPSAADAIKAIFTVARTAEQLAITFYTNGIANAATLGLTDNQVGILKAALIEEQIHQILFTAQGGDSLADTFSFPDGPSTFTDLAKFIKAQQQLEGAFDSAFLAAVKEFADTPIFSPALSQIAGQIAMVESEHRALGRDIGGLEPADNWAFAPVLLAKVADAPKALTDAGYLSPVAGNTYTYQAANFNDPSLSAIYQQIIHITPFHGDVDGNGKVQVWDAQMTLNASVQATTLTPAQASEADFNADGVVNTADVIAVLRRAIGL